MFLIISVSFLSCTGKKKLENAEIKVSQLFSAIKDDNEVQMKILYPGIAELASYYKSDTVKIKSSQFIENDNITVSVTNKFTNGYGKSFTRDITIFLQPDAINPKDYNIIDSKGLCGYEDNDTYTFGLKTGCINPKTDLTDQQIALKLKRAKDLLIEKSLEIYLELKRDVRIVNWSWESGYGGSASGKGIVQNNSQFDLPELKYKITYKDSDGNEITTDDGYVTYDKFYAGQSRSFTFYTSYIGHASRASIEMVFNDDQIIKYVAGKEYTGKECEEFQIKK